MSNPFQTVKQVLPYKFVPQIAGDKIAIHNMRGQTLVVSRDEITRQLMREDLDPHRRRMYERAKEVLREANR